MEEKDLSELARTIIKEINLKPTDNRSVGALKEILSRTIREYSSNRRLLSEEDFLLKKYLSNILESPPYLLTGLSDYIKKI